MKPATTYSEVLGRLIALRRKKLNITQEKMAGKLGMTQAGYSGLERGRSPFSVPQLRKVSALLGHDVQELLHHTDDTVDDLEAQGIDVLPEKPGTGTGGWAWIAGAVITGAAAGVASAYIANKANKHNKKS